MQSDEPAAKSSRTRTLKCVACQRELQSPIQLQECMHLVCFSCMKDLETEGNNVVCPKCKIKNVIPDVDILELISGVSPGPDPDAKKDTKLCNVCNEKPSPWYCYDCYKYMCASCRTHHDRSHRPALISQSLNVLRPRDEPDLAADQADSGQSLKCPLCDSWNECNHLKLVRDMALPVEVGVGHCSIATHKMCDQPQPLRFFCMNDDEEGHWRPVCGDCSERAGHKDCKTKDLPEMVPFINASINEIQEGVTMLLYSYEEDLKERVNVEDHLRENVKVIEKEIIERRKRILYLMNIAFDKIVEKAQKSGNDILDRYEGEVHRCMSFRDFLRTLESSLVALKLDETKVSIEKYVNSFELQAQAGKLLKELETFSRRNGIYEEKRFEEMRLILPSVPDSISIPPLLSCVGSECRHPRLIFTIPLDDIKVQFTIDSFIVTDRNKCIYTESTLYQKDDRMVELKWNRKGRKLERHVMDIGQGRYHIARMKSGEMVASREITKRNEDPTFDIVYCCDAMIRNRPSSVTWKSIYETKLQLGGVAVTADNNIFVCVDIGDEKGCTNDSPPRSYLMVLSLQGKVIKTFIGLHSAKHVAVSEFGEIAVSDPYAHRVIIMDKNFRFVAEIKYPLATGVDRFSSSERTKCESEPGKRFFFQPEGLCYDSYGRLVVADPDNNCVVRISRNAEDRFFMEPLIVHRLDLKDFVGPTLVSMDPHKSTLWVLCRRHIFVFDYQLL